MKNIPGTSVPPTDEVNVCQCIDCGIVFSGDKYTVCPRCETENFSSHLDIKETFYGSYLTADMSKVARQIRFYKESLADGMVFGTGGEAETGS